MKAKVIGCFLALVCLCGCSASVAPTEILPTASESEISGKLTLSGSTSMSKLCDALGEAFMEKYPEVQYEKANTGSGAAVVAVSDGTALIGDISRELEPQENPEQFEQKLIAMDGIAVIVSDENPVTALSTEQLVKIFTGEIDDWSEVGGEPGRITVVGRESASGTRSGFESAIGASGECEYHIELSEAGDVLSRVASDPAAIGYVSIGAVKSGSVHPLDINGVTPCEETVSDGSYPIVRPFYQIYLKGEETPLIDAWFSFVASSEGEEIIKSQDFVPTLPEEEYHD